MELKYKLLGQRARVPEEGTGRTVDFSSRGLRFHTMGSLLSGQRLEIGIQWPALLSGTCPLKLVTLGRVLRVDGNYVAVRIQKYGFHTRRTKGWPIEDRA